MTIVLGDKTLYLRNNVHVKTFARTKNSNVKRKFEVYAGTNILFQFMIRVVAIQDHIGNIAYAMGDEDVFPIPAGKKIFFLKYLGFSSFYFSNTLDVFEGLRAAIKCFNI